MAQENPTGGSKLNYPANSHKAREGSASSKESKAPEQRAQKVVTGEVVKRKKPLGKKIAETFAGDDAQNVGQYILFDVIIPAAKSMISDAVSQGIERMLFGDSKRRTTNGGSRPGYTSYNKMYSRDSDRTDGRSISRRARAAHDFDEIILTSRGEAEEVLDRLTDLIENYDVATVSDLYDLVGITGSFTDDKWGWTSLAGAGVSRVREGYLLNLPKTQPID